MTRLVICPAAPLMGGASLIYLGSKYCFPPSSTYADDDGVNDLIFNSFVPAEGQVLVGLSGGGLGWGLDRPTIHAPPK